MGNALLKLENFKETILAYKKCIKINPNNYQAYLNMGVAYHKLGKYDKAISAYKNYNEFNPN
jgi:tetratricopeptide (TPR) repeat protein